MVNSGARAEILITSTSAHDDLSDLKLDGEPWTNGSLALNASLNVEAITGAVIRIAAALQRETDARVFLSAHVDSIAQRAEEASRQAAEAVVVSAAAQRVTTASLSPHALDACDKTNLNGLGVADVAEVASLKIAIQEARRDIERIDKDFLYNKGQQDQKARVNDDIFRIQLEALKRNIDSRASMEDVSKHADVLLSQAKGLVEAAIATDVGRLHSNLSSATTALGERQNLLEERLDELASSSRATFAQLEELACRSPLAGKSMIDAHQSGEATPRSDRGGSIASTGVPAHDDDVIGQSRDESRVGSRRASIATIPDMGPLQDLVAPPSQDAFREELLALIMGKLDDLRVELGVRVPSGSASQAAFDGEGAYVSQPRDDTRSESCSLAFDGQVLRQELFDEMDRRLQSLVVEMQPPATKDANSPAIVGRLQGSSDSSDDVATVASAVDVNTFERELNHLRSDLEAQIEVAFALKNEPQDAAAAQDLMNGGRNSQEMHDVDQLRHDIDHLRADFDSFASVRGREALEISNTSDGVVTHGKEQPAMHQREDIGPDALAQLKQELESWLMVRQKELLTELQSQQAQTAPCSGESSRPASSRSDASSHHQDCASRAQLKGLVSRLAALEQTLKMPAGDSSVTMKNLHDEMSRLKERFGELELHGARQGSASGQGLGEQAGGDANLYKAIRGVQKDAERMSSKIEDLARALAEVRSKMDVSLPRYLQVVDGLVGRCGISDDPDKNTAKDLLESLLGDSGDQLFASREACEEMRRALQTVEGDLREHLGQMRKDVTDLSHCKANRNEVNELIARQNGLEAHTVAMVAHASHAGDSCVENPALTKVPLMPARCMACDRKVGLQSKSPNPWDTKGGMPAAPWLPREPACQQHKPAGPPPGYKMRRDHSLPSIERPY